MKGPATADRPRATLLCPSAHGRSPVWAAYMGSASPRRASNFATCLTTGVSKPWPRSEEHTSELQSRGHLVCRLLLEKKKNVRYSVRYVLGYVVITLLEFRA